MINLGNFLEMNTMSDVSRKDRASKINRSSPGLRRSRVLLLLVSTISLGCHSSLGCTDESQKVLVGHTTSVDCRGLAGTVKVTYGQVCAVQNE